jgi:hypothetical protein
MRRRRQKPSSTQVAHPLKQLLAFRQKGLHQLVGVLLLVLYRDWFGVADELCGELEIFSEAVLQDAQNRLARTGCVAEPSGLTVVDRSRN